MSESPHLVTARAVVAGYFNHSAYDDSAIVSDAAFALANAEREGMKRAAEVVREHTPIAQDNCDIRISATLEIAARAILSECGEG